MKHTFTLAELRARRPCGDGWEMLLKSLGNPPLDTRISIGDVAVSNGAEDAIWCLRLVNNCRERVRAVMPAVKRASVHTEDKRVHDCIATVERWLAGDDSVDLQTGVARAVARAIGAAPAEAAAWWAAAAAAAVAEVAAEVTAAYAATWTARAAAAAARATGDAYAERKQQRADLIAMFPPLVIGTEHDRNSANTPTRSANTATM